MPYQYNNYKGYYNPNYLASDYEQMVENTAKQVTNIGEYYTTFQNCALPDLTLNTLDKAWFSYNGSPPMIFYGHADAYLIDGEKSFISSMMFTDLDDLPYDLQVEVDFSHICHRYFKGQFTAVDDGGTTVVTFREPHGIPLSTEVYGGPYGVLRDATTGDVPPYNAYWFGNNITVNNATTITITGYNIASYINATSEMVLGGFILTNFASNEQTGNGYAVAMNQDFSLNTMYFETRMSKINLEKPWNLDSPGFP